MGGGWGENQKEIPARENAKKKNSCKQEGKEKKFMQKEGPIVTFQKVWVSEINNITGHNVNKQKPLSSCWKETIRTLLLIAASVPTTYTVYCIYIYTTYPLFKHDMV